jgi:hypothetical protein
MRLLYAPLVSDRELRIDAGRDCRWRKGSRKEGSRLDEGETADCVRHNASRGGILATGSTGGRDEVLDNLGALYRDHEVKVKMGDNAKSGKYFHLHLQRQASASSKNTRSPHLDHDIDYFNRHRRQVALSCPRSTGVDEQRPSRSAVGQWL